MNKTAGEIRFVKHNEENNKNWAWNSTPHERNMYSNHNFNPRASKHLARVLRSTLYALGHLMSAYSSFAKMKSRDISPDGRLGGKGYIQDIKSMRKDFMNCVEALSSISDTLYDEINAPHWAALSRNPEFEKILAQLEEVKEDPEQWAEEQEEELEEEALEASEEGEEEVPPPRLGKTASHQSLASKIATSYIMRRNLNG
jgi:hypothetical protein